MANIPRAPPCPPQQSSSSSSSPTPASPASLPRNEALPVVAAPLEPDTTPMILRRSRRRLDKNKRRKGGRVSGGNLSSDDDEMVDAARETRRFTCEDCGQIFAKSSALAEHAKSHAPPSRADSDSSDDAHTPPAPSVVESLSWTAHLSLKRRRVSGRSPTASF